VRIAFLAKRKARTRTTRYIANALSRAGHRVLLVRERQRRHVVGDRLAAASVVWQVRRFGPDLVLVHATDASPEVCRALGREFRVAMFTPDCWATPFSEGSLAVARSVHLLLTVARGQIPDLLGAGIPRVEYLAEAFDPEVHRPDPHPGEAWRADVAFIGKASLDSPHYARRRDLVRSVHERGVLRVYGSGWEELGITPARQHVYPHDYRRAVGGAKIVLGRDWTTDCEWYFSNRTWFTLGSGGFLLTNYVPRLEDLFRNHEHLVWYRDAKECVELIAHYLARPEERERIARAGRAYALAHRTYDHFARDLVDIVEGREPAFPPHPA
jgi:hypothetical protein